MGPATRSPSSRRAIRYGPRSRRSCGGGGRSWTSIRSGPSTPPALVAASRLRLIESPTARPRFAEMAAFDHGRCRDRVGHPPVERLYPVRAEETDPRLGERQREALPAVRELGPDRGACPEGRMISVQQSLAGGEELAPASNAWGAYAFCSGVRACWTPHPVNRTRQAAMVVRSRSAASVATGRFQHSPDR